MRFIGITGGVGAGKSEVLKYIGSHCKCEIYLADEVAHLIELPGEEAYFSLIQLLGDSIIDASDSEKKIDKKAMAAAIFGKPELLAQVNEIVHPAVKQFLLARLEEAKQQDIVDYFFVEAALLIEGGYKQLVDELWYIYADEDTRIRRLMDSRGYSREKAQNIIAAQLSEDDFRQNCDFVIDNSGALEQTYKQIDSKLEVDSWQK